jgi:hypothetical protein
MRPSEYRQALPDRSEKGRAQRPFFHKNFLATNENKTPVRIAKRYDVRECGAFEKRAASCFKAAVGR